MAKDYDNEFDHMEQDVLDDSGFVTDDIPEEEDEGMRQAIQEALDDDEQGADPVNLSRATRPVRKVERVVDDPLADSESAEDVTSGNYRRDTSDRGVYTGGTRSSRMMSDTLGSDEARAARRKKRAAKRRNRRIITALVIVALLAGCGAAAFVNRDRIASLFGTKTVATTEAPETTEAVTEAPTTTVPPTTPAPTQPAMPSIQTTLPKDSVPAVKTLVDNYYNAILEGHSSQLAPILDPSVEIDEAMEAELESQAAMAESFEDIATYAMNGMNAGEYAVFITYGMKLPGIDMPAPGLEQAYVRPDADGNLRLLRAQDYDDSIKAYVETLSAQPEVQSLVQQVDAAFTAAQEADPALKAYIAQLMGAAAAQGETAAAAESPQESEAESTAAQADSSGFTTVDDIQYTTTTVNLRSVPSAESDDTIIQSVPAGTWLHVIGDGAEWVHCNLRDGTFGYINKKYLTDDKPE